MARKQPIELFMPPNILKAKVGGGKGGPDLAAMNRAQAAMEGLKSEFDDWIVKDVKALLAARAGYADAGDALSRAALLRAAHDIRGQAPTFGFPLIARVAASLVRMLDELPSGAQTCLALVDAHVNAIQVIHKMGLKNSDDKTALTLCAELDARVKDVLAAKK